MFFLTGLLLGNLPEKLAYLDPGSGSFLLQLLIAALLGAGIALRSSWGKIKQLFGGKAQTEEDEDDDELDA